jgi:hypothetical protein
MRALSGKDELKGRAGGLRDAGTGFVGPSTVVACMRQATSKTSSCAVITGYKVWWGWNVGRRRQSSQVRSGVHAHGSAGTGRRREHQRACSCGRRGEDALEFGLIN